MCVEVSVLQFNDQNKVLFDLFTKKIKMIIASIKNTVKTFFL